MEVASQLLARMGEVRRSPSPGRVPPRAVKRGRAGLAPWLDRLDRGLEAERPGRGEAQVGCQACPTQQCPAPAAWQKHHPLLRAAGAGPRPCTAVCPSCRQPPCCSA